MSGMKMAPTIPCGAASMSSMPNGDNGDISSAISDCEGARISFGVPGFVDAIGRVGEKAYKAARA
jgi:hypothetical protein